MKQALVSLGANLGNSHATINSAANRLKEHFGADNVELSSLLCCPAIGGPSGQDDFHNAVASIRFAGSVFELWHTLREIEKDLGRERRHRWESRRIDLDILMFDQLRLWTPHLKIPHPRMVTRSFAILPAAQLLPNAIEPVSKLRLQDIAIRLPYSYLPTQSDLIGPTPPGEGSPTRTVQLFCVGQSLANSMQIKAALVKSPWFEVRVESVAPDISQKQFEAQMNQVLDSSTALIVLGIVCPDPLVAAWEDFSRPWARWLGFEESCVGHTLTLNYNAPRYLLNCFDLDWAVHELEAAISAMSCPLKFATPGWNT